MPPCATSGGRSRFSSTREAGEDAALLRHVADAGAGHAVQRQAQQILAVERMEPSAAEDAHDRAQGRRLAGPVAAEQRDRLALADVEIDAVQHLALAVPGLQVADFESRARSAMLGAHVGLAHRGSRRVFVGALGQDLAARQHRDPVAQIGHDVRLCSTISTVRPRRCARISSRDAADVLVAHAGHRLVEEQHLGIERQRRGDLQRALAAVGQFARPAGRASARSTASSSSSARGVERVERRSERQNCSQAVRPLQRDADVVEHGQVRKDRRDLERAHETEARHLRRAAWR